MARVPLVGGKEGAWEVGKKIKKGVDSTSASPPSPHCWALKDITSRFLMGIWGVGMIYFWDTYIVICI